MLESIRAEPRSEVVPFNALDGVEGYRDSCTVRRLLLGTAYTVTVNGLTELINYLINYTT
jgi:hypothetical protein